MQKLLSDNIENIRQLCILHNIKYLHAFGSSCTNNFNTESYIDLLIQFYPMEYGEYADTYFLIADKFEDLRNRVIHGYDKIDDEIIWGVIVRYLPKLKTEINSLLL